MVRGKAVTSDKIKIGLAQVAPIWLNRDKTLEKIEKYINMAGEESCQLGAEAYRQEKRFAEPCCPWSGQRHPSDGFPLCPLDCFGRDT